MARNREDGRNKRFNDKMEILKKMEITKAERTAVEIAERAEMFQATQVALEKRHNEQILLNKNN